MHLKHQYINFVVVSFVIALTIFISILSSLYSTSHTLFTISILLYHSIYQLPLMMLSYHQYTYSAIHPMIILTSILYAIVIRISHIAIITESISDIYAENKTSSNYHSASYNIIAATISLIHILLSEPLSIITIIYVPIIIIVILKINHLSIVKHYLMM